LIRLLDLPGAQQLQARLELCPDLSASSDERVRQLIAGILGVLGFGLDHWCQAELPELKPGEEPIDLEPYLDAELDGTLIAFWRAKGWDIAAPDGSIVRFFPAIGKAMIVVQEGRGSRSKMAVEAEMWRQDRSRRGETDPRQRRQDQGFLALGQRRRRQA
jgi:hypothetical protein